MKNVAMIKREGHTQSGAIAREQLAFACSLECGADLLRADRVRGWTEVSSACYPGSYCV